MSTPIETVPARILVQIREGVPNELATFDLPIHDTKPLDPTAPDTISGAKVIHQIDSREIIAALATAQRKLVQELRNQGAFWDNRKWLRDLQEWVLA